MAKQAFSSPQEVEQAEQEAQEKREEQEEQEEPREEPGSGEGEEQPEAGEQGGEEEEPSGEQGGEEEQGEEEEVSSELDDILSDHTDEPEVEPQGEEEEEEPEEPGEETDEYEALDLEIDNDRFEEITSDPEKFQEFISNVREDAVQQARAEFQEELGKATAELREEILQNIPEVVEKTAQRTQSVRSLRDQFFENNPGLKDKMGYVRDMTNTVSHQNPDWSAKQVLDEVAQRAQRDLNLSEQAQEREEQRQTGPRFAGAGGRRKPGGGADNRGKQEKLMDDTFGN